MNKSLVAAVLFSLSAAAALAQAPSPKVSELKPFLGAWRCTGKTIAPEHPTQAWIIVFSTLNGFWIDSEYVEDQTPQNPHPNAGRVHWGWDEGLQKYTGSAVNNAGGISVLESDGWNGDTIVWRGTARLAGATLATRDTFTRKSSREIVHVGEAEFGGAMVKVDEETCRRFPLF